MKLPELPDRADVGLDAVDVDAPTHFSDAVAQSVAHAIRVALKSPVTLLPERMFLYYYVRPRG